jgi:DNA polymerase-3 subunit epsilon
MLREIAFDTETTGLNPLGGDRIVEIGCVEMRGNVRTDQFFHAYINPERAVPKAAEAVHGLSDDFLRDKPIFSKVVNAFLEFIGDSPLVIHNAGFDMGFINMELERCGKKPLPMERAVDTVTMARKKFPGQPASLDALCRRFNIDLSRRTKHGALLDAELLADVYLELQGGRQTLLALGAEVAFEPGVPSAASRHVNVTRRYFDITAEERAAHRAFLARLKDPAWYRFGLLEKTEDAA